MGIGTLLCSRLLVTDLLHMELRTVKLKKDPACLICGTP
jgi:molybdopterin-synthase adenylyltransferase